MPQFSGPVQHVALSTTLWLVPLLPLVGCVAALIFGRRLRPGSAGRLAVGVLGVVAAFGASILEVARLAALPDGARHAIWHGWQMVRTGSVAFDFGLALDPLAAVLVLLVGGIGTLVLLYAAVSSRDGDDDSRTLAFMNLAVAAMLLLVLGDGFVPMAIGWGLSALATWLLVGSARRERTGTADGPAPDRWASGRTAFVVDRLGDAALVGGTVVLLWGLGGAWIAEGVYQPDNLARFVAVTSSEPRADARDDDDDRDERPAPPVSALRKDSPARLTFTAMPGARVLLDGREIDRSPFAGHVVNAGYHTMRILPGGAEDDYEVTDFRIDPGADATITVLGPSLVFREIGDQLVLRGRHGGSMRDLLLGRRLFGVGLVPLSCLLFLVAAAAKTAVVPLLDRLAEAPAVAFVLSTTALAGAYLVARLSFLFALSPTACAVVATVGALVALVAAMSAIHQREPLRIVVHLATSQLGLAFVGLGVGAWWAAGLALVAHASAIACLSLATASVARAARSAGLDASDVAKLGGLRRAMPTAARAHLVGCVAITAAPIPIFAGAFAQREILVALVATHGIGRVAGLVACGLSLAAIGCASLAAWRSHGLIFAGEPASPRETKGIREPASAATHVPSALALVAAVGGAALGWSARWTGAGGEAPLEEWLEPLAARATLDASATAGSARWGIAAIAFAVALVGWVVARKRWGAGRAADWEARERAMPLSRAARAGFHLDAVVRLAVVVTHHAVGAVAKVDRLLVEPIFGHARIAERLARRDARPAGGEHR